MFWSPLGKSAAIEDDNTPVVRSGDQQEVLLVSSTVRQS